MTGGWRKLHEEQLHTSYSPAVFITSIKSRRTRWARHVARMVEIRYAPKILVGKPEAKRPPGRPRRKREDNIKMDIIKTYFGVWMGFIWLRIEICDRLL
jgi:hypothetical protein